MVDAAPAFTWTGFYVGANGGWVWGDVDFDFITVGTSSNTDFDGGFAGGTVGVNWQWNSIVLGVEGDLDWAGMDGSDPCPNPAFRCKIDFNWLATARGRVGFAWNRFLVYGTGGVAFADVDFSTPPGGAGFTSSFNETYLGWTVGGGVEFGLTNHISIKGEYAYFDLGDETAPAGSLDPISRTNLDLQFEAVKFGLNYRF